MIEQQKEYEREHELDEQHNRTEGVDGPMSASMISTAKEVSSGKATGDVILDASRFVAIFKQKLKFLCEQPFIFDLYI
uniref:Uncharacterized protein n=1 Tax=Ascaris lumbricoides TaxID=6252 RepID=A0A0M3HK00_ASCLU